MGDLLLATTNPAKLARLRRLIEGLAFRPISPADLPDAAPAIPEDGPDFAANAAQKAEAWSAAAGGMLTLASDGGLEIPALGERWTALRTRRNAGPGADNAARIAHLLDLMRELRGDERRTYWHEAIALAGDGALLRTWTAQSDGGLNVEGEPILVDDAFWTESIRYYPAAGKLYRDLTDTELESLGSVWPRLRAEIQPYLANLATT
jgi:inosine/xanthosine triphosphate pyrophosphatase family protein